MALTGLQIFKYLPGGKKENSANCKKCGFPTCMAYAMKLAKNEASAESCEFIGDELKSMLDEASQKQQEEIVFGPAGNQVRVGNEIVMFRHEKTFVNPTCIAVKLCADDKDFDKKLDKIADYSIERVGETFKINAVALFDGENVDLAEKVFLVNSLNIPIIIVSNDAGRISDALDKIKASKPLVFYQNDNIDELAQIQSKYGVPVVLSGDDIESLVLKSETALKSGIKEIMLNLNEQTASKPDLIQNLTLIRRSAIENKFKPLGFPVISFLNSTGNVIEDGVFASILLCKYSNVLVIDNFDSALIASLMTLRQNIYTDPQKPLQVESKLYEIGEPDENSPLLVTTNFALTYFAVVSEIEASGTPAYLLVTPSDGMSVLTAWSASKFTGEIIAKAVKDNNVSEVLKHREMVIPGFVSSMKEEIEEELPDWSVVTGPNDAIEIVDFLKGYKVYR